MDNNKAFKDLAIVLPLYNPSTDWHKTVCTALQQVQDIFCDIKLQIIIVNDGSSVCLKKEIATIQEKFAHCSYIFYPDNQGKGYAIKEGLRAANARYYIYTDWDFPFGTKVLKDIYTDLVNQTADVVAGKRDKTYFRLLPFSRKIASKSLKLLNYFLLNCRKIDTQAGIKGLNEKAKPLFLNIKTRKFVFEVEFIRLCIKKKLKVVSQNVNPQKGIKFSNFKASTLFIELYALAKIALMLPKNDA